MKISVIVPCRNEKRHIRAFLESVFAQEVDPQCDVEILVADGMSDDGTREVLQEYSAQRPAVRVIDNPGRIVSTGLNAAIRAATGDLIIRMDAHTTYAPDYIRECVRAAAESGADNVGGPWVATGRGLIGRAIAAAFRVPFCTGGGKAHDPDYAGEIDTVYLGCWPRSVFDRVGLFDPELVRNQDDEFNFRLRRSGGKIWQSPRIKSSYTPRASLWALFRQYLQYGFWKVAVIRKHGAPASWRHLVPLMFVLANAFLLAFAAFSGGLRSYALIAWAALLAVYFGMAITAALGACRRNGWDLLPLLPVVFLTYHLSYGLGFLFGVIYWPAARWNRTRPSTMFTRLTR
ncbi:MAG: glycosyltransferase family 2 protein [Bryobacteraceae bacterium]